MRTALRLPRLEVRRTRQLRRRALRAAGVPVPLPRRNAVVPDARGGRDRMDVHGTRRPDAGAARLRVDAGTEHPPRGLAGQRTLQLPPGGRRRDRHRALVVRAQQRPEQHLAPARARHPPPARGRRHRPRLHLRQPAQGRRWPDLPADLPVRHAVHTDPRRTHHLAGRARLLPRTPRPHLGADRRREHRRLQLRPLRGPRAADGARLVRGARGRDGPRAPALRRRHPLAGAPPRQRLPHRP